MKFSYLWQILFFCETRSIYRVNSTALEEVAMAVAGLQEAVLEAPGLEELAMKAPRLGPSLEELALDGFV